MGQHQGPVESDPQALAGAQNMWRSFVTLTKVSTITVIVVLGAMALFLL